MVSRRGRAIGPRHVGTHCPSNLATTGCSCIARNAGQPPAIGPEAVSADAALKEVFRDLGITELAINGHIERILRRPPTIAIPIDGIPRDLQEWIVTLRTNVKLWVIEKFVSTSDEQDVLYLLPDENRPTLSTTQRAGSDPATLQTSSSQPFQELI
jgi:hypothetical protein